MVRVTAGPATRRRHKKILTSTKGYRASFSRVFKMAKQANMRAGRHAYIGRKQKKRTFRALWITRISAALRARGLNYSTAKNKWLHARMEIDRKNLSEIAGNYPAVFDKIVDIAR